MRNEV